MALINRDDAYNAINWNRIKDQVDLDVWHRVTGNFWLPEKIPLSNDIQSWSRLTDAERLMVMRVFTGLTLLDTMQGTVGCVELMNDATTPHEEAVLANFNFMEAVHAKSYSSIFSTLASTTEIEAAFEWSVNNQWLQNKADIIYRHYTADDPLKRKISSVMLESYMFYSGFFMPMWYSAQGKLTNSADIIRLIIRDESVHGYYIGYKFQNEFGLQPRFRQRDLVNFADDLLVELHNNEIQYANDLYKDMDWGTKVIPFMEYNADKALKNLGMSPLFDPKHVDPVVLSAMDPSGVETHDFFSGSGSTYVIGQREELTEDDWV